MPFAVILDTVSIQNFIFSTNNLRENLGASELVKNIYDEPLKAALKVVYPEFDEQHYNAWEKTDGELDTFPLNKGAKAEVGYIGGGNALLIFEKKEMAEDFVKLWSRNLLTYAPSLIPASAIDEIDLKNFSESMKRLFQKLVENKSKFTPVTTLSRHGITSECSRTGLSREIWAQNLPEGDRDYVSSVSYAKLDFAKQAKEEHEKILKELNVQDKYCFTDQLEELGQKKGQENYIAIVHIDGNEMSKRFRNLNSLGQRRKMSVSVRDATKSSFKEMLEILIREIEKLEKDQKITKVRDFEFKKDGSKTILPLRPIIIGGDDITFVSEGRLGVWLAQVFLEIFEKKKASDGEYLSACAGVSITKTKYPFYRGYRISEELLKSAKKKRLESGGSGSWLDFHLSYGGVSGSLEQIRKKHYETHEGSLLMRPYSLNDLKALLKGVKELLEVDEKGKNKFPRSKLHKIREALYLSETSQYVLIKELQARGLRLPRYGDTFDGTELIKGSKTPYFDMIELTEFYPHFVLKEGVKK